MARATLRQIAMEVLYKYGGLRGGEIGHVMALDYSTAGQETERLRESKKLQGLMGRIEGRLSRVKI
jgi:putative transposase